MLPPQSCHRAALNVATQLLPATTRRRRDDAEAATLTVAAGPRCPHSRCSPHPQSSPPGALTVAALRVPCSASSRCSSQAQSPQRPSAAAFAAQAVAAAPRWVPPPQLAPCSKQSLHLPGAPHGRRTAPGRHSRCSLTGEDSGEDRGGEGRRRRSDDRAVRMVRIAVRIEAERDDDDAARTGAGGVSRAVRIAVRIEGRRRRSDDDWDSFLWLPFVAAVCGYRLWLPFVATVCGYRLWLPMWLPMWLQPPGALTVAHSRCSLTGLTPDPRGWVRIEVRIAVRTPVRIEDERTTTGAGGVPKCSA